MDPVTSMKKFACLDMHVSTTPVKQGQNLIRLLLEIIAMPALMLVYLGLHVSWGSAKLVVLFLPEVFAMLGLILASQGMPV